MQKFVCSVLLSVLVLLAVVSAAPAEHKAEQCVDMKKEEPCQGRHDGHYDICGVSNWGIFAECAQNEATVKVCPKGLLFHSAVRKCVTASAEAEHKVGHCVDMKKEEPCQGRHDGHYDICGVSNWGIFAECAQNEATVKVCPKGLLFHSAVRKCVTASAEAEHKAEHCIDMKREEPCQGRHDGHYDICGVRNWGIFAECAQNEATVKLCPEGLLFHSAERKCVPESVTGSAEEP